MSPKYTTDQELSKWPICSDVLKQVCNLTIVNMKS